MTVIIQQFLNFFLISWRYIVLSQSHMTVNLLQISTEAEQGHSGWREAQAETVSGKCRAPEEQWHFHVHVVCSHFYFHLGLWKGTEKEIKLLPSLHSSLALWGVSVCTDGSRCTATPHWPLMVCVHTSFPSTEELSGWSYLFTAGLAICFLWKVKTILCHWGSSILLPQSPCNVLLTTTRSVESMCWKEQTPALWRVVPAFWIHRCHPIQLTPLLLSLLGPSQCLLITLKIILHWENAAPTGTAANYQCDYSLLGFQLHPSFWLKGPWKVLKPPGLWAVHDYCQV